MSPFLSQITHKLKDFVLPPLCMHCEQVVEEGEQLLCRACAGMLELAEGAHRCLCCFAETSHKSRVCRICSLSRPALQRAAYAFEALGPALSVLQKMQGGAHYLAEGMAACMAAQLLALDWPLPDVVIPAPISWGEKWVQGCHRAALLAEFVGNVLNRPVISALATDCQGVSLRVGHQIEDKTVLLVDERQKEGEHLKECAKKLFAGFPRCIYGVTYCN